MYKFTIYLGETVVNVWPHIGQVWHSEDDFEFEKCVSLLIKGIDGSLRIETIKEDGFSIAMTCMFDVCHEHTVNLIKCIGPYVKHHKEQQQQPVLTKDQA